MSSERQIRANQANAQKSTGPKSDTGKARSAQNARIHGLCAQTLVFASPDERQAFLDRCQELSEHYSFEHAVKQSLVTAVASAETQIRFVNIAKRGVIRAIANSNRSCNPNPPEPGTEAHLEMAMDAAGAALLRYPENVDCLLKLNRYELEQRRLFYKALQELEALDKAARTGGVSRRPATIQPTPNRRPPVNETKPISRRSKPAPHVPDAA